MQLIQNRLAGLATPLSCASSVALLGGLVWKAGPARLELVFATASTRPLLGGAAMFGLAWLLLTFKWWTCLRSLGERPPFVRLLALNLTAQLWGLILPAQIGGEVYRGGKLIVGGIPFLRVASAAFLDRSSTIVGTALVGLAATATLRSTSIDWRVLAGLAAVALMPAVGLLILYNVHSRGFLVRSVRSILPAQKGASVEQLVEWFLTHPNKLAWILILGVLAQIAVTACLTLCAHGFGMEVDMRQVALALTASALLPYLVPLPGTSAAIQQGAFVYLLARMGFPADQAGALAFVALILVLLFGAIGTALDGGVNIAMRRSVLAKEGAHGGQAA